MIDTHVHTTYSDGKNTPREMIEAALKKGLTTIGFSDHSYTAFDESYCIKREDVDKYVREIKALHEEYAGIIEVGLGLEQDYYSDNPDYDFDYLIGSVHYVKKAGVYIPVDESADVLKESVERYFGGDFYAFAEAYYENVGDLIEKTNADIIGHFDLITKFNENDVLFSTANPRYVSAWKKAADRLTSSGAVFEINTGAISRGYRKTPYPSKEIIDYIKSKGGLFILSSDAHNVDSLAFGFEKYSYLL